MKKSKRKKDQPGTIIFVDDLGQKILSPEKNEAFSQVDIEVKQAEIEVDFGEIVLRAPRVSMQLRGVQLAAAILIIGMISLLSQLLLNK
jgi:hypothetical protein